MKRTQSLQSLRVALQESEARFRAIIENASDLVTIVGSDATIRYQSPVVESMLGYRPEEMVGHNAFEYVHPDDIGRVRTALERGLREGVRVATDEYRVRHKDGSWRVHEAMGRNLLDEPALRGIVLNVRDVTQRRQADDRIRWLTAAVQQNPAAVLMTRLDGTIEYVNQTFEEATGYSAAEAIGRKPSMLQSGLTPDETYRDLWDTILAGGCWRGEIQNRRKNGELYWHAVVISPIRDARGVMTHFLAVQQDITEQRRVANELQESEERFRQMAETIKEAFFVFELPAWRPIYGSPTWAEIWGRSVSEGLKTDVFFEAIHPDDRAAIQTTREANQRGESTTTAFRVRRPDGSVRWVRGRAFPVRDTSGAVYRLVGVAEDITELRAAEEQATQAQKMEAVGRLAGGVAHDFNNLLTVILGEVELLQMQPASSEVNEALGEIKGAAERATGLTRQLLAFSRKQLVQPTVFRVNDLVTEMGKMLQRLIGEDLRLTIRVAADPGSIRADRGQIEQVLVNLVVNARDAMPKGGVLEIETQHVQLDEDYAREHPDTVHGHYVLLSVSDTGTGMTPEVKARIFEPFFTTKEQGKGTGLGLATSYGIVKQAGGHIAVYSEVGHGTTFKVYLPRVAEEESGEVAVVTPTPRGSETILLVEDDKAVREVAARVLIAQGYTVLQADSGKEAWLIAEREERIDLVLTDVVLPGVGGREIAEGVAALRPGIRVLFATGYTDDVVLQNRLLVRGVNLIQKPFTRDALSRKVREVLDQPAVRS